MSGSGHDEKKPLGRQKFSEERREVPKGTQPYTYVDHRDGTAYEWDWDKKAWFPKESKGFLGAHQASYGFPADSPSSSRTKKEHETGVSVTAEEKFLDKRATQNIEKKQKKESLKQDGFKLKRIKIQMFMLLAYLQMFQRMNLYGLCPNVALS